jgi:hypothetical protein
MAALAMIIGGAGIAIYGFTHVTGASASTNTTGTTFTATETHNTTLGVIGLAIAAGGGVLYGVGQKKVSPEVSFGHREAKISGRWRW